MAFGVCRNDPESSPARKTSGAAVEIVAPDNLPARVPDLTLWSDGNAWRIGTVSPRLEAFLKAGEDVTEADLLAETRPPLSELADEVMARGADLESVPVRLGKAVANVEVRRVPSAGQASEVRFFFREAAAADRLKPSVFHGMVGVSPAMLAVFRKIELYGPSDASVVITGETGTGKELAARALHEVSPRAAAPYVALNCSALSRELLESELFGHEKGAFTGALTTHRGCFERANGGTLFLDEVGDMAQAVQVKLLRVLENRVIERVGGERVIPVDVRIVCATNVELEQAVAAGQFRADLYHRLAVLRIHLPPLRERLEDLPFLVDFFLAALNRKYHRQVRRLTPEAIKFLRSYLWPGNIRELRNLLERVLVESSGEIVGLRSFREWAHERHALSLRRPIETPATILAGPPARPLLSAASGTSFPVGSAVVPNAERLRRAYEEAGGNISQAARLLGMHRATFYRHLKRLELTREKLGHGEKSNGDG